jgi:hypothetical protein
MQGYTIECSTTKISCIAFKYNNGLKNARNEHSRVLPLRKALALTYKYKTSLKKIHSKTL